MKERGKNLIQLLRPRRMTDNSSGAGAPTGVHAWEKWHIRSHYVLYVLLVFSMVSAFFDGPPSWSYRGAVLGLTLLFGGWHWSTVHSHPEWSQCRPFRVLVYFAVALLLFVGLTYLHPAYMSLVFFLYWNNYSLWPPRWAIPGTFLLTALVVWRGSGLDDSGFEWPSPAVLLAFGITAVVSIVLTLFIDSIIRQSAERKELIEELEATRRELAEEERRAGVLEERGRLAQEIHDTLAQGFVSIITHLEAADDSSQNGSRERHLDQAQRTARENLTEARRLVAALRPEILEGSSLSEALERLASRWSESSGVSVRVNATGEEGQVPQEIQVTLLRAAQEALSNVRKHARASEVTLTLSHLDGLVVLDVQDDGAGFEPDGVSTDLEGGFGLKGMRERAERLGGSLLVESAPGEGTTLVVELPVEERAASFTEPS